MGQSKNDPSKRAGNKVKGQKTYKGKPVRPVLYIYRNGMKRYKYMAVEYDNGSIIEDSNGNPIRWNAIQ